jgi:hypothetical protein
VLKLTYNGIQKEYCCFGGVHAHGDEVKGDCCCAIFTDFDVLLFAVYCLDLLLLGECWDSVFAFPLIIKNILRLIANRKVNNFNSGKFVKHFDRELDLFIEYSRNIPYPITCSPNNL